MAHSPVIAAIEDGSNVSLRRPMRRRKAQLNLAITFTVCLRSWTVQVGVVLGVFCVVLQFVDHPLNPVPVVAAVNWI